MYCKDWKRNIKYYELDKEDVKEMEERGLKIEDTPEAWSKVDELLSKEDDYEHYVLLFLGNMDLDRLMDKSMGMAEYFMAEF